MLNTGQKCILCLSSIDTPMHLFQECRAGFALRDKLSNILVKINRNYPNMNCDQKVYCSFNTCNNTDKNTQYLICVANYSIYRIKLKKMFNRDFIPSDIEAMYSFIKTVKLRIVCDHRRLEYTNFIEIWDPDANNNLFSHNCNKILSWNF